MQKKSRWLALAALLLCAVMLSGCYSAYRAARDERSLGTQMDDAKRATNIKYALLADDSVKGLDISVSVYNGTAYLIGIVEQDLQKDVAVAHAKAEEGVRSVKTYLRNVNDKTLGESVDDTALAAKIRTKLIKAEDFESTQVKIESVLGHVVLLGIVDSPADRDRAIAIARSVEGVKKVKSFIVIQ
ncbi:transport-associated protein [Desulfatibacillum aliphaticivorans]|uniref:Transport-associated protein n=1 Tax=Desulfatibacillum aliphaticivorans TaxID=218208 RepID=B8FF25_DESAL|nr:BON domain-containing protein [Desulfatibacillum aliphaticivorans]ACL03842.1 transport-associated protein [Desulfatibacillum aliphaticivorans]